jgi:preprotein translocase subunit SecD
MQKDIDFVVCPECDKKFKELNKAHLGIHGLTVLEFDKKYPNLKRISATTLKRKNTLENISDDVREKLRKSHTLDGYIERYGDVDGRIKFANMKNKKSKSKTLEGYIARLGTKKGLIEYQKKTNNISLAGTLEGYIKRFGKTKGLQNYNQKIKNISKAHKIEGYIERYGAELGVQKWEEKCEKISEANRKVNQKQSNDFSHYKRQVMRLTYRNIRKHNIKKNAGQHIDHKYSIVEGFLNKIAVDIIAHIENLQTISIAENCSKQGKCSITLEELLNKTKKG